MMLRYNYRLDKNRCSSHGSSGFVFERGGMVESSGDAKGMWS